MQETVRDPRATPDNGRPPVVALRAVTRRFTEGGPAAVDRLTLDVAPGEILALLGPSGSGKTTLLRLVAGFERPDDGEVWIAGRRVAGGGAWVAPEARGVGMVFQDYALFPHLTVAENVEFGLHCVLAAERGPRTTEVLDVVGMRAFASRYPHELSGGEQQRVALARALAPRPFAVLLDEPFSNLDADLRRQVREEVRGILASAGISAVFVTHDQEEALMLGDRVAVINDGRLEQVATPEEVFHAPRTRFVAGFFGRADFLPARVTARGLETEAGLVPQGVAPVAPGDGHVDLLVRPDDVTISASPDGTAVVLERVFAGSEIIYRVQLPSGRVLHSRQPHTVELRRGARVAVRVAPGHALACFKDGVALAVEAAATPAPEPERTEVPA
jgi:iron(III) transport system ATP-binding protein